MRKIQYISCVLLFLLSFKNSWTQQVPIYSQYMMNSFLINPASAGANGYTLFNLTTRKEWIGLKNAPNNQSLAFQTRFLKKGYSIKRKNNRTSFNPGSTGRIGMAGSILNDQNGIISKTGLQMSYAYHINLRKTQLSLGLSGSLFQLRINEKNILPHDNDDPFLLGGDLQKLTLIPDAGIGIYLLNNSFFGGFSAQHLFESIKIGNISLRDYKIYRTYYLNGGFYHYLNNQTSIQPSFLLKTTDRLNFQGDFSMKLFFKEMHWMGLSYRTTGSIIMLLGTSINSFYIGYSFDYPLHKIRKYTYGSHELVLAIKLGSNIRRLRWIERF